MNIENLKEYTKSKHNNQTRKHGTPYYLHPFAVAQILKEKGYNINYQITALFHDLIEDTDTTYEEILNLSNIEITTAVKLLTKEQNYDMNDYIERIKKNDMAKAVKLADRIHNLIEAPLASVKFRKKYIHETKKWYFDMAKDTVFELELNEILKKVEESII